MWVESKSMTATTMDLAGTVPGIADDADEPEAELAVFADELLVGEAEADGLEGGAFGGGGVR